MKRNPSPEILEYFPPESLTLKQTENIRTLEQVQRIPSDTYIFHVYSKRNFNILTGPPLWVTSIFLLKDKNESRGAWNENRSYLGKK